MCFPPEASPPPAPRDGALADTSRTTLRAADGAEVAATVARTTAADAPGVVIVPDVRGLHPYYERLSESLAGAGAQAVAVDFYGRTAGARHRGADFEFAEHRAAVRDETLLLDVAAGVRHLIDDGTTQVYVWGFCFGGRAAFLSGTSDEVAGVIGFYGWPAREGDTGLSPVGEAAAGRLTSPVLAVYGGADEKITEQDRAAFDAALEATGVPHRTRVYAGAPHSFFDKRMDEHADACADAWREVLDAVGLGSEGRS